MKIGPILLETLAMLLAFACLDIKADRVTLIAGRIRRSQMPSRDLPTRVKQWGRDGL